MIEFIDIAKFSLLLIPILIYTNLLYFVIYNSNNKFFIILRKFFFSNIPFLQISNDANFHTIKEVNSTIKYRYSLFFIPFGIYKIYICTYCNGFSLYHILSLEDFLEKKFEKLKEETEANVPINVQGVSEDDEIEIIKDNINLYSNIKNVARIKSTIYITLFAALISVLFTQINNLTCLFEEIVFLQKVIFIYICILFFNFVLFNIQYIVIKSFYIETYEDYKEELNRSKLSYYYKNMIWTNFDSGKNMNYVINIEQYLIKSFIFTIIFIIIYLMF